MIKLDPETKWSLIGATIASVIGINGTMLYIILRGHPWLCE